MNKTKIEGVSALRNDLIKVYEGARNRQLGLEEVRVFSNVAGKIINSAKAQVEYHSLMKYRRKINFLEK